MKHGSLFTGIGGFDLAAQWMGWENVFQVEWDKWCQKALAKNFPDTLRFGDIVEFNKMLQNEEIIKDSEQFRCDSSERKEKSDMGRFGKSCAGDNDRLYIKERIGHINIITGGFPCQPFSHAGKRKGTDDSRYLWPEMLTTIRILKPSFVVGENVAGLVSMENGKTLDRILSDLEDEGYTTEQVIVPACAVGAWHRRDRIWIIARNVCPLRISGTTRGRPAGLEGTERPNKGCEDVAHSRLLGSEIDEQQAAGVVECCENVPNCHNQGLQGRKNGRNIGGIGTKRDQQPERYGQCLGGEDRTTQCGLGGMASGLPRWVDGYWDREPEGVPRVATGVKDRVNRLKGLGNAIVPQVAFQIFKAIEQYNEVLNN